MSELLGEQKRYYAERAPEYDDWWHRRGRYELEPEALARWQADVAEAEAALEAFAPGGAALELAAGTGIWTRKLVQLADRVVAVDANAETLALNTTDAELVQADVFEWRPAHRAQEAPGVSGRASSAWPTTLPAEQFELVFFSFWLSHVPEERFDEFWSLVRAALAPGGRVFLVDSGAGDTAHTGTDQAGEEETRSLADGRTFRIVKRRWAPAELAERVRPLGFELRLCDTANGHFLVGGGALA
ncbi:MAG TPA: class I SAM-dependent methyltransferase [Gaiellaceae bacterium]|nr:class I SAM-dependent methyltransferase [Gaiellaceae bacterium]